MSIPPTAKPNFQLPETSQPDSIVIEVAITLQIKVLIKVMNETESSIDYKNYLN